MKYKIRREVLVSSGIISGKIIGSSEEFDILCEPKVNADKITKIQKEHRTLNAATKHLQNYTRIDKFHRYLQKCELVNLSKDEIQKNSYLERFQSLNGHYANSASLAIVKIHEIITHFGFYEGRVWSRNDLVQSLCNYLFTEKTYDLFNKLFKPLGRGWIFPTDSKKKDFAGKITRYISDILKVYNFRINRKKNKDEDSQFVAITDIPLKSIELFKSKIK